MAKQVQRRRGRRPVAAVPLQMRNRKLNDWAVALVVIACSILLFLALAFALSGASLGKPSRLLHVNFHEVTGIVLGSQVKYAGAIAGKVSGIRMLNSEERTNSGDPLNAIQVTLALNSGVPPLPSDTTASIAADTLLSDKFILLSGGSSDAQALSAEHVLQGISPTTYDKLARDIDGAIEGLRGMLSGTAGEAGSIFERIRLVLTETQSLLTEAKPVVQDARTLLADARQLVTDAKDLANENSKPLSRAISQLEQATGALENLAVNSNKLVLNNERKLSATVSDLKVSSENLKVASTYAKIFVRSLSQRPSQLIWGTSKPPPLPSEQQILRSSSPLPAN